MSNDSLRQIKFARAFVDSVTIRPFFADLKRMSDYAHIFRPLPRLPNFESDEDLEISAA